MSTPQSPAPEEEETQLETQSQLSNEGGEVQLEEGAEAKAVPVKRKREKQAPVALAREPGKSLLPFSRVQKIIKADKDIPIIARDATYLISLATEEFIRRLCEAGQRVADREKRATVQHKDIATVVRKADEFLFLEEIIPWITPGAAPKRGKPKGKADELKGVPTMLDQFVVTSKDDEQEEEEQDEEGDVVMNEDGTMFAGGDEQQDNLQ